MLDLSLCADDLHCLWMTSSKSCCHLTLLRCYINKLLTDTYLTAVAEVWVVKGSMEG